MTSLDSASFKRNFPAMFEFYGSWARLKGSGCQRSCSFDHKCMFCGEAGHGLWQSTPKGGRVCRAFEIFEKECETFETQHFSLKDREDDLVAMLATALRPKLKPADPRLAALGGPPSTAPPQPPAKAPPPPPGEVQDAALKAPQLGVRSKAALDPNRVLPVKAQALPPGP